MPNGVQFNSDYPKISKSQELYERAKKRIPAVTQTLAKGPGQYVKGVAPIYLERGQLSRVWDVDGNEYLDFNMAIGPLSLGYQYPKVDEAIRDQLEKGITFSLMHPLELEVAELVAEMVPNAESVRFSKTGADATSAAVRISRAFTGRRKVACCGYHGWHDWYIGVTSRNAGIPTEVQSLTTTFNYNDMASVEKAVTEETACVILEPMLFELPTNNFLQRLKEVCQKKGALLIFDEMWTGFRLAAGGAQEFFDVKADLATFSKAVANGMPISILAGRKDVMAVLEEDVFFYTTFGGEALSLAAAKATMTEIRDKQVPAYLSKLGQRFRDGFAQLREKLGMDYVNVVGMNARTMLTIAPTAGNPLETKSLVQQEMIKRGILWSGPHVLSFSHTEKDVDYLLATYAEVLPILKRAVQEGKVREWLRGEPVQPVFRTISGTVPQKKA